MEREVFIVMTVQNVLIIFIYELKVPEFVEYIVLFFLFYIQTICMCNLVTKNPQPINNLILL